MLVVRLTLRPKLNQTHRCQLRWTFKIGVVVPFHYLAVVWLLLWTMPYGAASWCYLQKSNLQQQRELMWQ